MKGATHRRQNRKSEGPRRKQNVGVFALAEEIALGAAIGMAAGNNITGGSAVPNSLPNSQSTGDQCHKDFCEKQYEQDVSNCGSRYSYEPGPYRRCMGRAAIILKECLRGEPEMPPWSDGDEDGWVPPRPQSRH